MSIILDHINYCYSADSAYKVQALKDVCRHFAKQNFPCGL